jgi:hypothetical protein
LWVSAYDLAIEFEVMYLLGIDNVHYHAAFEHLRQSGLNSEVFCGFCALARGTLAMCSGFVVDHGEEDSMY